MPRVPRIQQRSDVPAEAAHHFDSIASSRGRVSGPFSVLLNSPEVAGRAAHLGAYIRFESTLDPDIKELAIITTSREFDCHLRVVGACGIGPGGGSQRGSDRRGRQPWTLRGT